MTVFSYLRLSHQEQFNNGISLDTQEDRIKKFADLQGMSIDKTYSELVSGNVEFRKRKVFNKIMEQIKSGDTIITSRLDRLSRNTRDLLNLVEHFKKNKINLYFVDIGKVTDEGIGRIFLIMLSAFAENERIQVSERIKQNKKRQTELNRYKGGYVEFSKHRNADGSYSVNEKEQEILNSIIDLRKHKFTYRKISEEIKKKYARKLHYSFIYKLCERNKQMVGA